MPRETTLLRFVRGLLSGTVGVRQGDRFVLPDGRSCAADQIMHLVELDVLMGNSRDCRAGAVTRDWLLRARLDSDQFAAQHRLTKPDGEGRTINLSESPLSRLASGETAFLEPHHVEAGEHVRRLIERAQLQPRVTMSYSVTRTASNRQNTPAEISDMAAESRRSVAAIHRLLPRDCAGVVIDVCGLLKGLQDVERERGWPRRSAKLVLRIGLDQLAQHYGFGPFAVGSTKQRDRAWLGNGARPERFE